MEAITRGILYKASGDKYIDLATQSAKSVKNHSNLPVSIYTDESVESHVFDQVIEVGDSVNEIGDSILNGNHFPYDRNLYLDADTYVDEDLTGMFDILDKCDIALAHDISRGQSNEPIYDSYDLEIPNVFPEYNSGVILYNDCESVRELYRQWNKVYKSMCVERNQPALRIALYQGDINICTLPPEFNYMCHRVGFASGKIKIFHFSGQIRTGPTMSNLEDFVDLLNRTSNFRVMTWERYPCRVIPDSHQAFNYRIRRQIDNARRKHSEDGSLPLIVAGLRYLLRNPFW